jgi:hypothetical protein
LAQGIIRKVLLIEATIIRPKQRGPCQVRSKTTHPCPHQAVVEICGVPFCEPCAREQKAYFAMGELTQDPRTHGLRNEPLVRASGERTEI